MDKLPLPIVELHREKSYGLYGRYIAYNLLKDIRFEGEPVVPTILREGKDSEGEFFEVEKLGGEDLGVFMKRTDVDLKKKTEVILHIVDQLMAIDQEGYVIPDRLGTNIRIIEYKDRISTRQIDCEAIFDKQTGAVYATKYRESTQGSFDRNIESRCDPWISEVQELLEIERRALEDEGNSKGIDILSSISWHYRNNPRGSNLVDLKRAILNIIDIV